MSYTRVNRASGPDRTGAAGPRYPAAVDDPTPDRAAPSDRPVEDALRHARHLVETALRSYQNDQRQARSMIETHTTEEMLEPIFAQFLHQARHHRSQIRSIRAAADPAGAPSLLSRVEQELLSRGGVVRALFTPAVAGQADDGSYPHELVRQGAQVRVHRGSLSDVTLLDRQLAVVPAAGDRPEVLVIRAPEIVRGLREMHMALWEKSVSLTVFCQGGLVHDDEGLLIQVLARLCAGAKDETAARALGLSVRTYRRHVATIMTMLDANSRFQAGVRAARLGLAVNDTHRYAADDATEFDAA